MPSSAQLASIASSLDTYRTQFETLGNALSALRLVSDEMIAQLDRDRAALETHLQAALETMSQADIAETDTTALEIVDAETAETDAAGEVETEAQYVPETIAEVETEVEAEAVADDAIDGETIAALETEPLAVADDAIEATSETETEATLADPTATDAPVIAAPAESTAATANTEDGNKVISLADRRKATPSTSPARRRAIAVVASILFTAGATFGLHELIQTEVGQRMLELATCDGDMLSATRDCSLLAWLTI